jgi:hypothetical protein
MRPKMDFLTLSLLKGVSLIKEKKRIMMGLKYEKKHCWLGCARMGQKRDKWTMKTYRKWKIRGLRRLRSAHLLTHKQHRCV